MMVVVVVVAGALNKEQYCTVNLMDTNARVG